MVSIGFRCEGTKKSHTTWGNIQKKKNKNVHTLNAGDRLFTCEDDIHWILLRREKISHNLGEHPKK